MNALETAILYAKHGFYVFPIQPGSKYPYKDFKWKEKSTNNIDIITKSAKINKYANCNWAIDTGKSGIFIIDIDLKKNKNGINTLKSLPNDLTSNLIVKTPSGGMHYYYKGIGKNSVEKIGKAIDTRGVGGYALIPGSINKDKKLYQLIKDEGFKSGIPEIPEWIKQSLGTPMTKPENRFTPLTEYDMEHNINAAKNYLLNFAPEAIQGYGGDIITYTVACKLRDYGLSQNTCRDLMCNYWNCDKAHPAWDIPDLNKKIENAFLYANKPPGNSALEIVFNAHKGEIPPIETEKLNTGNTSITTNEKRKIKSCGNLYVENIKPRDWLLGYRYLPGYVTLTIAPGGVGKSLATILEGLSVVSGRKLTYDEVKQKGAVWLFNTEDPFDELERRILAAAKHHGIVQKQMKHLHYSSGYEDPLIIAAYDDNNRPVLNPEDIKYLSQTIREKKIKLLILDPFIECHRVKENDNDGINLVMQALRKIASENQCAISIIHHSSKGNKDAAGNIDKSRGASSLASAARIAHTLYPMTKKEAAEYNIPEDNRNWYIRLDDAKTNLSPPSAEVRWLRKRSVKIFFNSDETTGTLEKVIMEKHTAAKENDIIIKEVTRNVLPRKPSTVYAIAKNLSELDFIDSGIKKLQRKIWIMFETPMSIKGFTYFTREAQGNRPRSIFCTDDSKEEIFKPEIEENI